MGYVSKSCDCPKKDFFDGLHKHLKIDFDMKFPKKEIPYQAIVSKKRNFGRLDKQSKNRFLTEFSKKGISFLGNFESLHKLSKNRFFDRIFQKQIFYFFQNFPKKIKIIFFGNIYQKENFINLPK